MINLLVSLITAVLVPLALIFTTTLSIDTLVILSVVLFHLRLTHLDLEDKQDEIISLLKKNTPSNP